MPPLSQDLFKNIVGHKNLCRHLSQLATTNRLPQIVLLTGPAQIGKTTILLDLAAHLSETKTTPNPWLYTNTGSDSLKIQEIRAIQHQAAMTTPFRYQIFLIKNIERLTLEAANALLKLFEEPPAKTKFFLTTSTPTQLPQTILSRCQIFRAHPLSDNEISLFQEQYFPKATPSQELISLAQGKPGLLATLQNNPQALNQLTDWANIIKNLIQKKCGPASLIYSKELSQFKKPELLTFLKLFQSLARYHRPITPGWANNLTLLETSIQAVQANYNAQLTLDNLFLKLHF